MGAAAHVVSGSSFTFLDDIHQATATAADAQHLLQCLQTGELLAPWRFEDGLLHRSCIFVPDHGDLYH